MGRLSKPFRLPFASVILVLVVLFLTGCEEAVEGDRSGSSGNLGAGGADVPVYSSIAAISFGSTEAAASQEVRAQESQGARLRQLRANSGGLPLNYAWEEESDGLPVFYTPTGDPDLSSLGPVWDLLGYVNGSGDDIVIEYT